jgi:pimeloyl-ACP methyl ester carboxylesterase
LQVKLVLLPGMDGTGELFANLVAALPKAFETQTVRYPADRSSYAELADVVRAATPNTAPFVLIAESFSTPLAIQYAAANPENLKGLILCAGFAASPVRGFERAVYLLLAPVLAGITLPKSAARFLLVGQNSPLILLKQVRSAVSSVPHRILSARIRAVLTCNVRAELGRIGAPILYIHAKYDRLVNASCFEEIQRIQPRAEVVSIDGPHLILQREPERTAEIIARFVQRL